jgi:hypothetical protein
VRKKLSGKLNSGISIAQCLLGWDHYANKWEVIDEKGTILGTRILHHPHVNEQPFTRSLSDIRIPASTSKVIIRGHDLIHEYGGKVITVDLRHL